MNIFTIVLLFTSAFAWQYNNPYATVSSTAVTLEWIDQIIDHFNYNSDATFKQRYYILNDYFKPSTGPVYLYICGQA